MNGLFTAAGEVQRVCEHQGWAFCFIGGLAVLRWGNARLTRDVDVTVITGFGGEQPYVDELLRAFTTRVDEPVTFATRHRVALLRATNGVPVDVALGALPFEIRTVERSSLWAVPDAPALRTCAAEDLVVHKVFAGRDHDWADVEGVLARQRAIDAQLVVSELRPLLHAKSDETSLDRLRELAGWR